MSEADTALAEKLLRLVQSKDFCQLQSLHGDWWVVLLCTEAGEIPVLEHHTLAAAVDAALERVEQPKAGGEP